MIRTDPADPLPVHVTKSLDEMQVDLRRFAGTRNDEVAAAIAVQVANSFRGSKLGDKKSNLIQALKTIEEMEPRNLTEAMLAAQMIATNEAASVFLQLATIDGQTFEGRDANVLRATRLMRLHLEQIEAMQKLKGRSSQQRVTVEHVHVHDGGQAIVGTVASKKGGVKE